MENNNSSKEFDKALRAAIAAFKATSLKAKKIKKPTKIKKDTIFGSTLIIIGTSFVVAIVIMFFILLRQYDGTVTIAGMVPAALWNTMDSDGYSNPEEPLNYVKNGIENEYQNVVNKAKVKAVEYANSKYGCGAYGTTISNSACQITINVTPTVDEISKEVLVYTTAVNNTYLAMDNFITQNAAIQAGAEKNELGEYEITNDILNIMYSSNNEYFNVSSSALTDSIKNYAEQMLMFPNEHGWQINIEEHQEIIYLDEENQKPRLTDEERPYIIRTYYTGSISIPLYVNLESYKSDMQASVISKYASIQDKSNVEGEAIGDEDSKSTYNNLMYTYLTIAAEIYGYDANFINQMILNTPSIYTLNGAAAYGGVAGVSSFDYGSAWGTGYISNQSLLAEIWGTINAVDAKMGSKAAPNNCTTFVNAMLYWHFGVTVHGNGSTKAIRLVENYPDIFEFGQGPSPGGIVSFTYTPSSGSLGHVIFVNAVEYSDSGDLISITISEGNLPPYDQDYPAVRILHTFDSAGWNSYKSRYGTAIYANPIQ